MSQKEKKWFGITRSPEEDLALVEITRSSPRMTARRVAVVLAMSVVILAGYLAMNRFLFPAYPVTLPFAERFEAFTGHYPPFRLQEWTNYEASRVITEGDIAGSAAVSPGEPIGYSLAAAPLTAKWGESGMYYTNAIVMWLSALVFFFLMLELVEFRLAVAATLLVAFASPNFFFAASAFGEPSAQLLLLLSILFFVKGMVSHAERLYFLLCGAAAGLILFFQPYLAAAVLLFLGLIVAERGRFTLHDNNILSIVSGFSVVSLAYLAFNRIVVSEFLPFSFLPSAGPCLYGSLTRQVYGPGGNIIPGVWMLLFDSPHGLVFLMPVTALVPLGLVMMWRSEMRPMTIVVGVLFLYVFLLAAAGACPIGGESLGSRRLLPVIPLLFIPPAFLLTERKGERILLVASLVMTVYMSMFGWWLGTRPGEGLFVNALHDHAARSIVLARKNELGRPPYRTANDLRDLYMKSLERNSIGLWLGTLDRDVLDDVHGSEREVFERIRKEYLASDGDVGRFIESVDPDRGVRPLLTVDTIFGDERSGGIDREKGLTDIDTEGGGR